MPQTRERIRGRDALPASSTRPSRATGTSTPKVVIGDADARGGVVRAGGWTAPTRRTRRCSSSSAPTGLITKVTDFWPEPYDPPERATGRWSAGDRGPRRDGRRPRRDRDAAACLDRGERRHAVDDDDLRGAVRGVVRARARPAGHLAGATLDGEPVGMLNLLVFTRMPFPRRRRRPTRPTQWGYLANCLRRRGPPRPRGRAGGCSPPARRTPTSTASPGSCSARPNDPSRSTRVPGSRRPPRSMVRLGRAPRTLSWSSTYAGPGDVQAGDDLRHRQADQQPAAGGPAAGRVVQQRRP